MRLLGSAWHSVTMLVTPRPGANPDNLIQNLQRIHADAFNLWSGGRWLGA